MIYTKGTLSTTSGSPNIVGISTRWLPRIHAGDILYVDGSSVSYYIAAVLDDTNLRLTEGFAGGSLSDVGYVIVGDFSRVYSIPYPKSFDIEKASTLQRKVRLEDRLVGLLDVRVLNLEYPAGTIQDITSTPSIDTVFIPGTGQDIDLTGYGIGSSETFGSHVVQLSAELITADSDYVTADSNSATADGSWGGALPTDTLIPVGIASAEAVGSPVIVDEYNQQIYPTGIPSGEAVEQPILTSDVVTADNNVVTADSFQVTADGGISSYITISSDSVTIDSYNVTADALYLNGAPPDYLIDTDSGEFLVDTDSQEYLEDS